MECSLPGSSVHGDSPVKNTGVGCHALLQGIFPMQRLNPGLPCCRQILYHLSHPGNLLYIQLYINYIIWNINYSIYNKHDKLYNSIYFSIYYIYIYVIFKSLLSANNSALDFINTDKLGNIIFWVEQCSTQMFQYWYSALFSSSMEYINSSKLEIS